MQTKKKHQIKVGADPEFFLQVGDTFIPSTDIIGGTKKLPIPIPGLPEGFTMQEDNIMGEFNIPPADNATQFSHSIELALNAIQGVLPKETKIVIQPSALFRPKFIRKRAAKVFGCDPDTNAWTEVENTFTPAPDPTLRCCGGHIHIGLPSELMDRDSRFKIIRISDVLLGLPSIVVDTDTRRRQMYGKAGSFRFKDYGVEYRTLSNFWTKTPNLREWAFNSAQSAVDAVLDTDFVADVESNKDQIIHAINEQDATAAERLCNHFNVVIP